MYLKAPAPPESVVSLETSAGAKELGKAAAERCGVFPLFLLQFPSPPFAPFSGIRAQAANFEEVVAEWEKRGARGFLSFFSPPFLSFLISVFCPALAAAAAAFYLFRGGRALLAAEG